MSTAFADTLAALAGCLEALAAEHKKTTHKSKFAIKKRSHSRKHRRSSRRSAAAAAPVAPMAVDDAVLPLSLALERSLDDLAGLTIVPNC